MFSALFRRAELAVDRALIEALHYTIIVATFLVALGFFLAYLTVALTRVFGLEIALAAVAALCLIGSLGLAAAMLRRGAAIADPSETDGGTPAEGQAPAEASAAKADRDLNTELMASLVPIALPVLLRIVPRQLLVPAAAAAAAFIVGRTLGDHKRP